MVAGNQFQRNFTWPIPDPPKSDWSGAQESQFALQQKAIGFNCLNYNAAAEASLYRHFLPEKSFMDANCTDGMRLELMFPSCWNGKDVDSPDHKSHMAYPSLVMDGDCPAGFETRLVSLFYETIWNTYAFKDCEGQFVLANGDPTGFGYHGDFIQGWDPDFLQQAVDTCTSPTGLVNDCALFDLQDDETQGQCQFAMPNALRLENALWDANGIPGNVPIQAGPAYATEWAKPAVATGPPSYYTPPPSPPLPPKVDVQASGGTSSAPSPPATTDSPTEYEIVMVQQDVYVLLGDDGEPVTTSTGTMRTMGTSTSTAAAAGPATATDLVEPPATTQVSGTANKRDQLPRHLHPSIHYRRGHSHGHGHAHHIRKDYD
jgi:hypothetical protein